MSDLTWYMVYDAIIAVITHWIVIIAYIVIALRYIPDIAVGINEQYGFFHAVWGTIACFVGLLLAVWGIALLFALAVVLYTTWFAIIAIGLICAAMMFSRL